MPLKEGSSLMSTTQFINHAQSYRDDGVVILKQAFDTKTMGLIEAAYAWSHAHLSAALQDFAAGSQELFIADTGYSVKEPVYLTLLRESVLPDIACALFGGESDVWYLGEQIFYKEGESGTRRTPWHQDTSYMNFVGPRMVALWIPLDPIPRDCSLEVVRGSHTGITYNGSRFELGDDTAPLYPISELPRLPDIESDRDGWEIVGEALVPGDLIAFHLGTLHGGGATLPGMRRRSLTLRFIGDDVVWVERSDTPHPNSSIARRAQAQASGKSVVGASTGETAPAPVGEPVWRSNKYLRVRPWA
jgi:ectoine hydroxylase-related dioxygenase (phytanoyl-CoA dioxygenase family)